MIKAVNVTKRFGSFHALKNVSFEIEEGEIVGFLGKNGAGKTTLMRILTTYLQATYGNVFISDLDVDKKVLEVRSKIGYLPESPPLYNNMSVKDYLKFAAAIKDIPSSKHKSHIERVVSDCQLGEVIQKPIHTLSKGFKQRVGIAQAIINDPDILILDEPTSGLDPTQIHQVRRLIKNLEKERIVLLSTHHLSEIENLVQRVLIIKEGEIVIDQDLKGLTKEHQKSLEQIFLDIHE